MAFIFFLLKLKSLYISFSFLYQYLLTGLFFDSNCAIHLRWEMQNSLHNLE